MSSHPPWLLVAESDQVSDRPNDRVQRQLVLRLTAVARDQADEAGQTIDANVIADQLLVAAHLALFANKTVDGLAIGLQELDCDWQEEDADADLCCHASALPDHLPHLGLRHIAAWVNTSTPWRKPRAN